MFIFIQMSLLSVGGSGAGGMMGGGGGGPMGHHHHHMGGPGPGAMGGSGRSQIAIPAQV